MYIIRTRVIMRSNLQLQHDNERQNKHTVHAQIVLIH